MSKKLLKNRDCEWRNNNKTSCLIVFIWYYCTNLQFFYDKKVQFQKKTQEKIKKEKNQVVWSQLQKTLQVARFDQNWLLHLKFHDYFYKISFCDAVILLDSCWLVSTWEMISGLDVCLGMMILIWYLDIMLFYFNYSWIITFATF